MAFSCIKKSRQLKYIWIINRCQVKNLTDGCGSNRRGLILGLFSDNDGKHEESFLTNSGDKYNKMVCNRLKELLRKAGPCPKKGEYRVFYDLDPYYSAVAVVGIGKDCSGYNEFEQIDEGKEAIRIATGVGAKVLQAIGMEKISVEGFEHSESAAEGSALSIWLFQEYKNKSKHKTIPLLDLWDDCDWSGWQIGLQKAAAQNLARQLSETPSNLMTPSIFAQNAVEVCCRTGVNVEVKVKNWAETQGMGAFLSAAKGSCQPPIFLELSYYGTGNTKDRPVVLVGKGTTFDCGGINLSEPRRLTYARGDMSGAACVVATCRAIAAMNLPINVRGLIPLCENMIGCNGLKPGDVAVAMNGTNILIQDTRLVGELMLADTLLYAQKYWPLFIVDIGTMTRGVRNALGTAATGVFTNSDTLWKQLRISAAHTGDRVWRMPLFNVYKKMLDSSSHDIKNKGRTVGGGETCKCAAFLREFVPCGEWMHLDNFSTFASYDKSDPPYYRRGLTGRPTRTLIEFVSQCVCKH